MLLLEQITGPLDTQRQLTSEGYNVESSTAGTWVRGKALPFVRSIMFLFTLATFGSVIPLDNMGKYD